MAEFGTTVLTVGIEKKSQALKKLPLRILVISSAIEAITHLFEDQIDAVISHWDLIDMPNGGLLKNIIAAKPDLPTIAFVKAGDPQQEILARQLGVSIVLADDINDECFCGILRRMFALDDTSLIKGAANTFENQICCL